MKATRTLPLTVRDMHTATKTLALTINPAGGGSFPTINFFRQQGSGAPFPVVAAGQPLTLEWSVTGATSITLLTPAAPGGNDFVPQTVPESGSLVVHPPSSCDYFLQATGDGTASVEAVVRVSISTPIPPPAWDGSTTMALPDGSQGPDFGTVADIQSVASGDYEAASTWNLARIPTTADRVRVQAGHTVTVRHRDAALAGVLDVRGVVAFDPAVNTRLSVMHGIVRPGGLLQMGTPAVPKSIGVTMSLALLPPASFPAGDTNHLLGGLIVLGSFTAHSAEVRSPFVRLAQKALAGDRTLMLESVPLWWLRPDKHPGDRLILPDSRHIDPAAAGSQPQHEVCEIASVNGAIVTLLNPLAYTHDGCYDPGSSAPKYLPHAINLIAGNIGVRTSDPNNPNRGYVWMGGPSASLDVQGVAFHGLGRVQNLGNAASGVPRGAVQVRNAPVGCQLIDCSSFETRAFAEPLTSASTVHWGFLLWNCANTLLQRCNSFNWMGACIAVWGSDCATVDTCSGFYSTGTGGRDPDSVGGHGLWSEFTTNHIRHCIVGSGGGLYGFNIVVGAGSGSIISGNGGLELAGAIAQYDDCESYGGFSGAASWFLGLTHISEYYHSALVPPTPLPSTMPSVINDLRIWHTGGWGLFAYDEAYVTYNNLTVRGDPASGISKIGVFHSDYIQCQVTYNNLDVRGCSTGFSNSGHSELVLTINGATLENVVNVFVVTPWSVEAGAGDQYDRTLVLNNVVSTPLVGSPLPGTPLHILFGPVVGPSGVFGNLIVLNALHLTDWQGVSGANYRCYASEQAADYIVPQTGSTNASNKQPIGCPVAGLTNAQAWVAYHGYSWNSYAAMLGWSFELLPKQPPGSLSDVEGCAIYGAVAPAGVTPMPGSQNVNWIAGG